MEDISTGAKIGIGLVVLCFLVTITLSLLMIVKNITNSGSSTLQSGLDQMLQTQFDDYDQTVKTGTEVNSAVKLFNGQAVAILVRTKACQESEEGLWAYNYGALLEKSAKAEYEVGEESIETYGLQNATPLTRLRTTDSYYTMNLAGNGGGIKFNLNVRPTSITGGQAFVRSSAKFIAELIKDNTGTTVGIVFTQQT